jgi:hypothetical protein
MNLVDYIVKNKGVQRGDEYHDSFIRYLSTETILKSLGINPPYNAIEFEVKAPNSSRRCDLIVLNHELTIIEAKVIRSPNPKTESRRIKEINKQLVAYYPFFKRKRINAKIRLIGVYKRIDEDNLRFYDLPSCGASLDNLEILQIPCL